MRAWFCGGKFGPAKVGSGKSLRTVCTLQSGGENLIIKPVREPRRVYIEFGGEGKRGPST